MRPLSANAAYTILSTSEARKITGLNLTQLRALPGVQLLSRTFADGRREDAIRVPTQLLDEARGDAA